MPEPYNSIYDRREFDACREDLGRDGLIWFFNLQIPNILAVIPLIREMSGIGVTSARLTFLQHAVNPECDVEVLSALLDQFKRDADFEGAAACTMLALGSIWENCHDFSEFAPWVDEADSLLAGDRLPALARSALLLQYCWTECAWHSDLWKVNAALPEILRFAELAGSPSLALMHSALAVYVHGWQGDLAAGELILHDAEPYLSEEQASPVAVLQYHNSRALLLTLQGEITAAIRLFQNIVAGTPLDSLPKSVWLLLRANYLHCLVASGNIADVQKEAGILANKTVPEQKRYYHSYLHFNLGIADLTAGRPYKALLHAEEAQRRGELCGSLNAARMSSLLKGQALTDLERDDEALELFHEWLPKWEQAKYFLLAAQACFEMALIHARKREAEKAKSYLRMALSLTPLKEKVPALNRPGRYREQVALAVGALQLKELQMATPIYIQCLGKFVVTLSGEVVDLTGWRGQQPYTMLQIIIALGGADIPIEKITDLLWPDAEGDRALGSFKVSLSRLRKSLRKIYPADNWILVKNGRISLNSAVCTVDSALFSRRTAAILSIPSVATDDLLETWLLYTGDFLGEEGIELWQTRKRENLRRQYAKLTMLLALNLRKAGRRDQEASCLEKALEFDGANEKLYAFLMENYLAQGYKSKAMKTFYRAKASLQESYGVAPGRELSLLQTRAKE